MSVLFAVNILASCALQLPQSLSPSPLQAQQRAALSLLTARQERLYRVAAPLLVNNAVLCRSNARALLGFTAKNQYSYSSEMMDAAKELLGLDERLQVMNVLAGSGAARAGIRRGDILLKVQEQALPQGPSAESDAAQQLSAVVRSATELQITVLRNAKPLTLQIPLTMACSYSIDLGNADFVNAYDDGRRILITRGMLDYLQSDAELAVLLAQEIAHNTLRHAQVLQMKGTVAAVIDKLLPLKPELTGLAGSAGIKTMPAQMDIDADRLALYMLARAAYSPNIAATTWQHLALNLAPNGYTVLHPWTDERLALLQATAEEIRQKQLSKKPLVP
jgi:membrane-associated protease RseP (regulator of RpoE activity)